MGIRRIEDALRVEPTKRHGKMYVFRCVAPGCSNEVRFQRSEFENPRRTGLCRSCRNTRSWSKARKPYERLFDFNVIWEVKPTVDQKVEPPEVKSLGPDDQPVMKASS